MDEDILELMREGRGGEEGMGTGEDERDLGPARKKSESTITKPMISTVM